MTGPYSPPPAGGPGGPGQYPPAGGPQWQGGPQGPGPQGPGPQGPGPQGSAPQPPPGPPSGAQWQAPAPAAPAAPRNPADLAKTLALVVAGLGLLNFIWGFLPAIGGDDARDVSLSVFGSEIAFLPALLFIAGLLALGPLLPKGRSYTFPVAVISVIGGLTALFTLVFDSFIGAFASASGAMADVGHGVGYVLLLIFGLLQAAAAVFLWLTEAGIAKPAGAASPQQQAAPTGWGYPPAGGQQGGPGPQGGPYGGPGPQGGMPPHNPPSGQVPPVH